MPIKPNDLRIYNAAASLLQPPVTAADCARFPTLEQIVTEENKPGRGATIRHGRGFAKRTPTELADLCNATPLITGYQSGPRRVVGLRFFDKTGPAKLEVDVGAGWVVRSTTYWITTEIIHTGAPLVPGNKIRVTNKYGIQSNVWTVAS